MADIDTHELSAHTQTRSPNPGRRTNRTEFDLEHYRIKEEFKRELQNCHRQIEILREELFHKNQEIQHLNGTVILKLKQELNEAHKEKIKHYQESEKTRKQIDRLKNDNHSLEQEVERGVKDRRTYYAKLEDLKELKQATKRELFQNEKIIKNYAEENRRLQKEVATLRAELEDTHEQIRDRQKRQFEADSEYKTTLQKNFTIEAELRNLQLRHKDTQNALNGYRQQINHLEQQREQLLDRLEDQESNVGKSSELKVAGVVEVRSLMDQIYGLLEEKGRDKKQLQKRFLKSMAGLERSLTGR